MPLWSAAGITSPSASLETAMPVLPSFRYFMFVARWFDIVAFAVNDQDSLPTHEHGSSTGRVVLITMRYDADGTR